MVRLFIVAIVLSLALLLAGCVSSRVVDDGSPSPPDAAATHWLHSGLLTLNETLDRALGPATSLHSVGYRGPEPTLGVTSNGYIFFVASSNVLRSTDHGASWDVVSTLASSPITLDPMLWVDPSTDRVFSDQLYLGCSWLSYSDDYGASWTTNPIACGLPVNDHQKVTTGPYVAGGPLEPASAAQAYRNVVYYAYNQLHGGRVAISLDGGITFPHTAVTFTTDCEDVPGGGLHGHITAGPDGTVYVPARNCGGPIVTRSLDNGLTWSQTTVHDDIGTAKCDKNPEVAVDTDENVHLVWPGADNLLYLSTSTDHGSTWGAAWRAAPPEVGTTTMPVIAAGDPGRIGFAYYGTKDDTAGPDEVDAQANWHMFLTFSLNALDPEPEFTTVQLTPPDDPIQVGPISTNSGSTCPAPAGSRNLLDFIDIVISREGRALVAFADGCTDDCILTDMNTSRDAAGVVAIVQEGPSLFADIDTVMPISVG